MKSSIKWGLKLSLFSALVAVSNMNAQKFHVAGHLVKCATNTKLPANTIVFIEGDAIPAGCTKITGSGDAVPVAKGAIYNQDNIQGVGLPGGLWRKSSGYNLSNLDSIKVNDMVVKGFNKNIGIGQEVLGKNTEGDYNIAIGEETLSANTTGFRNVAIGKHVLMKNTTGYRNIAIGDTALSNNTTGDYNIAIGEETLSENITGDNNLGMGSRALQKNTTGFDNVALGYGSLQKNTTGSYNVGIGLLALNKNTTGDYNIAIGYNTLRANTVGSNNIAIGYEAGSVVGVSKTTTLGYKAPGVNTEGYFSVGYDGKTFFQISHEGAPEFRVEDNRTMLYIANKSSDRYFFVSSNGTIYNRTDGSSNLMQLKSGGTDKVIISQHGQILIGTTSSVQGMIHVASYNNAGFNNNAYFMNYSGHQRRAVGSSNIALYASGGEVAATAFFAVSDARIKVNKGLTNNQEDLATLNKIKVTNYMKKDPNERHHSLEKKVIAQELEQVYPTAVNKNKDVVPDVYLFSKQASVDKNKLSLTVDTNLDKKLEKDSLAIREHKKGVKALRTAKKGEEFKLLIFQDNEEGKFISEIRKVALTQAGQNGEKLSFDLKQEDAKKLKGKKLKVLVYGRHVDDFRTVDYEAVSMLNVSATQALASKVEKLEAESNKKDILLYVLVGVSLLLGFANLRKK